MDQDLITIEAYLNNLLSEEERQQVDQRILKDREFAQKVDQVNVLLNGIAFFYKKQTLRNIQEWEAEVSMTPVVKDAIILTEKKSLLHQIQNWETEAPPIEQPKAKIFSIVKKWSAVAAIITIAIIGVFWLLQQPKTTWQEPLVAENFEPLKMQEGGELNIDAEKKRLQKKSREFYDQKDWANASSSLNDLATNHQDTLSLLYLGISQLANHQPEAALLSLQKFQQHAPLFQLEEPTQWYQSLAQLETGQTNLAASNLNELLTSNNYNEQAKLILIGIGKETPNLFQDTIPESESKEDSPNEIIPLKSKSKEPTPNLTESAQPPIASTPGKNKIKEIILDSNQKQPENKLELEKEDVNAAPPIDSLIAEKPKEEKESAPEKEVIIPATNMDCSKVLEIVVNDSDTTINTTKCVIVERERYRYVIDFKVTANDIRANVYSENGVNFNQGDEIIFIDNERQRKAYPFVGVPIESNQDGKIVNQNILQLDWNALVWMASKPMATIYIKKSLSNKIYKFTINQNRQQELQLLTICLAGKVPFMKNDFTPVNQNKITPVNTNKLRKKKNE